MRHLAAAAVSLALPLLLGATGVASGRAADPVPGQIAFASTRDQVGGGHLQGTSSNTALFLMNGDGTDVHRSLRLHGLSIRGASWSPDRTQLAVEIGDPDSVTTDIAVVDLTGRVRWLTRSRKTVFSMEPAWSPNGDVIAFASNRGGYKKGFRIFTIHPDGSGLRQLSPQRVFGPSKYSPFDRGPTWSPDTKQIAYACWEGLCVQDVGTQTLTQLATGLTRNAAWSPDGSTIAFDRPGSGGNGDVWTVDVNRRVSRDLTNTYGVGEIAPTWSPDSKTIAYQRTAPRHQDIWAMLADGTHRVPLAPAPGYDGNPAWAR
jgi:Tol biopolymer transport system component